MPFTENIMVYGDARLYMVTYPSAIYGHIYHIYLFIYVFYLFNYLFIYENVKVTSGNK